MIFDVILRMGKNGVGKDIFNVIRVHDRILSYFLRKAQDDKYYIISVIPLFRSKRQEGGPIDIERETLDEVLKFNKEAVEAIQEFKINMIGGVDPVDTEAVDDYRGY